MHTRYKDNLRSVRIRTRFLPRGDEGKWLEYCSDPMATRFTQLPGKTPAEMAESFTTYTLNRYETGRLGLQALLLEATGEFIGLCGLLEQQINGKAEIEIGYHLLPWHWGKGYATEAAQLFRDYAFENDYCDHVISLIDPLNLSSQRVAARNGMRLVERADALKDGACDVYKITRKEWEAMRIGKA